MFGIAFSVAAPVAGTASVSGVTVAAGIAFDVVPGCHLYASLLIVAGCLIAVPAAPPVVGADFGTVPVSVVGCEIADPAAPVGFGTFPLSVAGCVSADPVPPPGFGVVPVSDVGCVRAEPVVPAPLGFPFVVFAGAIPGSALVAPAVGVHLCSTVFGAAVAGCPSVFSVCGIVGAPV